MDIHAIEYNAIEYIVFRFNLIYQSWGGGGYICQLKPTFGKKNFQKFFPDPWWGGDTPAN